MKNRNKKGITLIELLITLAIMTIILASIYSFFLNNYITIGRTESAVDLQSNGQRVMEKISENAIAASDIVYDENNDQVVAMVFKSLLRPDSAGGNPEYYYCIFALNKTNETMYFEKVKIDTISYGSTDELKGKLESKIDDLIQSNNILGQYISDFTYSTLVYDENDRAREIEVTLTLEKPNFKGNNGNKLTKVLSNRIVFRN